MAGFMAKPNFLHPYNRKETWVGERKDEDKRKHRDTIIYQIEDHPVNPDSSDESALGPKLPWLVWRLILKFPHVSTLFYALLWASSIQGCISCTSVKY